MKLLSTLLTGAALLIAGSAFAATLQPVTIDNLTDREYSGEVQVSGVVTWIEEDNVFTLADSTGDIEVNLATPREGMRRGDFVTVSGVVDPTLADEIDNARVTVQSRNYQGWNTGYRDTYRSDYDLGAVDADLFNNFDRYRDRGIYDYDYD